MVVVDFGVFRDSHKDNVLENGWVSNSKGNCFYRDFHGIVIGCYLDTAEGKWAVGYGRMISECESDMCPNHLSFVQIWESKLLKIGKLPNHVLRRISVAVVRAQLKLILKRGEKETQS